MISVRDTGMGINPEDYDRIFRPFEQAKNPISGENQGTGLGLSLTRKFVELHGGRYEWKVKSLIMGHLPVYYPDLKFSQPPG